MDLQEPSLWASRIPGPPEELTRQPRSSCRAVVGTQQKWLFLIVQNTNRINPILSFSAWLANIALSSSIGLPKLLERVCAVQQPSTAFLQICFGPCDSRHGSLRRIKPSAGPTCWKTLLLWTLCRRVPMFPCKGGFVFDPFWRENTEPSKKGFPYAAKANQVKKALVRGIAKATAGRPCGRHVAAFWRFSFGWR